MLRFLSGFIGPIVSHAFTWLDDRALVIPKKDLASIAAAAGTTPEALQSAQKSVVTSILDIAGEYLQEHWKI
jgi:pantothenate kinase type III